MQTGLEAEAPSECADRILKRIYGIRAPIERF